MPRIFLPLIVFLCIAAQAAAQERRERDSKFIVNIGDEMPHFSYTTQHGDMLDSDFLRGQIVLLNFSATWCPFSIDNDKRVEKLWQRLADNPNFTILCLNEDNPADTAAYWQYVAENNLTFPIAFDEAERIYKMFVTPKGSVTRTIVFDSDGKITGLYDIYTKKTFRKTVRSIERQLKEKAKNN